jgi:hypothetical protein
METSAGAIGRMSHAFQMMRQSSVQRDPPVINRKTGESVRHTCQRVRRQFIILYAHTLNFIRQKCTFLEYITFVCRRREQEHTAIHPSGNSGPVLGGPVCLSPTWNARRWTEVAREPLILIPLLISWRAVAITPSLWINATTALLRDESCSYTLDTPDTI